MENEVLSRRLSVQTEEHKKVVDKLQDSVELWEEKFKEASFLKKKFEREKGIAEKALEEKKKEYNSLVEELKILKVKVEEMQAKIIIGANEPKVTKQDDKIISLEEDLKKKTKDLADL